MEYYAPEQFFKDNQTMVARSDHQIHIRGQKSLISKSRSCESIEWEDFAIGVRSDDLPPWYEALKPNIVEVTAEHWYGDHQSIATGEYRYLSATARVRHELHPESHVCGFHLIIWGDSLCDAQQLHRGLLAGKVNRTDFA
jgi:hypothetical protein